MTTIIIVGTIPAIVAIVVIRVGCVVGKASDKIAEFCEDFSVVGSVCGGWQFLCERGSFIGSVRGKLEKVGIVLGENVLDFLMDNFLDLFSVVGITLGCRGVFVPS